MSKICATIAEKNKIPEVAIEEIFKVERNNRVLFRYLKEGKPIKHEVSNENSKDFNKDKTINPQNFLRR